MTITLFKTENGRKWHIKRLQKGTRWSLCSGEYLLGGHKFLKVDLENADTDVHVDRKTGAVKINGKPICSNCCWGIKKMVDLAEYIW